MKKISMIGISFLGMIAFVTVMFFNACTSDPCKDVICQNGGNCSSGTCVCTAGYEGTNCEIESRTKFFGTYSAHDVCDTSNFNYNPIIATSSTGVTSVIVTNPFAVGVTVTVTATIDGSTITIPTGSSGNGYTFSGSGTLSSDEKTITWSNISVS